eukprot:3324306-Lingulodinium_polyedra.AAC.1
MTAFRLGAKGFVAGVVFISRADFVSLLATSTHTASIMLRKCWYSPTSPAQNSSIATCVVT